MRSNSVTTGLVLAALLGLADLSVAGIPGDAPPAGVKIAVVLLGLATLAGVVTAWRGGRAGLWTVMVTRAVSALGSLPGLFDSEPSAVLKGAIVAGLVLTALALALLVPALRHPRVTVE